MMMQPAGVRHSPNHHQVVLMNWARRKGLSLGREGYEGYALYVGKVDGSFAFIVEGRGSDAHPVGCIYPYLNGGRWRRSQFGRARAFAMALDLFLRLTDQASPGDGHAIKKDTSRDIRKLKVDPHDLPGPRQ